MADLRLICAPWLDPGDRPDTVPDNIDDDQWTDACWAASELLWGLSGRQFSGGCESTVTLDEPRAGWCGWVPDGIDVGWPAPPGWAWRGGSGRRVVALPDPPVTEVTTVEIGGSPAAYHATLPVGLLRRVDGRSWPTDGTLAVTYNHGIPPPAGGRLAAGYLAVELVKSYAGDTTCQLPKRITTLSREGVAVGFQDGFESLSKARTGIWQVDSWLVSVNPAGIPRRARVWTPELARAQRITT